MKKSYFILWGLLASVLILIIGILIFLPIGIRAYINHQLQQNPDYTGEVAAVSVHYLQPGLSLYNLHIEDRATDDKSILEVHDIELILNSDRLLTRHWQVTMVLDQPDLTYIVLAPVPEAAKKPPTYIWQVARSALLPTSITDIMVHQGTVHYVDKTTKPPFAMYATDINAVVTGLQQNSTQDAPLPARLGLNATTIGGGDAMLQVQFNPQASLPTFNMSFSLENVELNQLGSSLEAYTDLRARQGEFNLYVEAEARQGQVTGYAKPFFKNVKLIVPKAKQESPIKHLYKAITEWLTNLLKNNETKHTATKIDFKGHINDPDTSMWSVIVNILRNAFVEALLPQFDGS